MVDVTAGVPVHTRRMSIIQLHDVSKAYGTDQVLDHLDLDIRAGEIFALLGPNGAGKTTAVEIMEGYRRPDSGSVTCLGFEPDDGGARFRSLIGIVLQQTTSFERSTVRETVDMFGALFPGSMSTDDAIELVDLGPQEDQIADTMSGGQRRRLDLACGLVGRPELLFLDEPTTGLDPEARRAVWAVIRDLRDSGVTVVLTTHMLDEAEALADRVGVLIDGRIVDVATPDRIGQRDRSASAVRFDPPPDLDTTSLPVVSDGDAVVVTTEHPDRLVADLVARHGGLAGLTISRPSLEDVYLDMVAHVAHQEVAR
jgi:ABC-2 type transport system ATP-binding protein